MEGALKSFQKFSSSIHKAEDIIIDNTVFKLHYRFTVIFLLGSTVLISLQQYFGEHIRCIANSGVSTKVINTYCFFKTTFVVAKHLEESVLADEMIPHPGIGPFVNDEDIIRHHAYYQWVPFVLSFQAVMFYIPHLIWKHLEGERMKTLVAGLELAALATSSVDIKLKDGSVIPSREKRQNGIRRIQKELLQRLYINRPWAVSLVSCEILNALNLCLQIFITDAFLGGVFWNLGPSVISSHMSKEVDTLEVIFPKMTKCTFLKYGPSGSIQNHDALCVMSLNAINEKIYTFLWFWLVILTVVTALGLIWRLLTVLLYSRRAAFNAMVINVKCPQQSLGKVIDECHFSDWLFLRYLGKNVDDQVFQDVLLGLATEISEAVKPDRIGFYSDEAQALSGE
jgi:hypothetical protein